MADAPVPVTTPPASGARPQVLTPGDQLVQVGDRLEPLSKVTSGFVALSAAEQKAVQQANRVQQLEAQLGPLQQDAANWQQFNGMLVKNPDEFEAQVQRLLANVRGQAQPNSGAGDDAKLAMKVARLEQELGQMRNVASVQSFDAAVAQAIEKGGYALLQNSPEARAAATSMVRDGLAADPKRPLADIVSEAHTVIAKIHGVGVATTVAQRTEQAANLLTPPVTASPTPGLTNPPPAITHEGWKSGDARATLRAKFLAGLTRGPNG